MRCDYCGNEVDRNTMKCVSCGRLWNDDVMSVIDAYEPHRANVDTTSLPQNTGQRPAQYDRQPQYDRPVLPQSTAQYGRPTLPQQSTPVDKQKGTIQLALAITALILGIIVLAISLVNIFSAGKKLDELKTQYNELEEEQSKLRNEYSILKEQYQNVTNRMDALTQNNADSWQDRSNETEPFDKTAPNVMQKIVPDYQGGQNSPQHPETEAGNDRQQGSEEALGEAGDNSAEIKEPGSPYEDEANPNPDKPGEARSGNAAWGDDA